MSPLLFDLCQNMIPVRNHLVTLLPRILWYGYGILKRFSIPVRFRNERCQNSVFFGVSVFFQPPSDILSVTFALTSNFFSTGKGLAMSFSDTVHPILRKHESGQEVLSPLFGDETKSILENQSASYPSAY